MNLHLLASKLTIKAEAKAIAESSQASQILLSAPSGNTGTVFVGDSTVTTAAGYPIPKGTSIGPLDIGDTGAVYVIGTAEDTLNCLVLS